MEKRKRPILLRPNTKPVITVGSKPTCLGSGLYIHINNKDFKRSKLVKGDYYWDVDYGLWIWDGKKFVSSV